MNGYQGQLYAKDQENSIFNAGVELFDLIKQQSVYGENTEYIKKISIFAPEKTKIALNNISVEIGSTGIYETDDVEITSIQFLQDSTDNVIIDYIIEKS